MNTWIYCYIRMSWECSITTWKNHYIITFFCCCAIISVVPPLYKSQSLQASSAGAWQHSSSWQQVCSSKLFVFSLFWDEIAVRGHVRWNEFYRKFAVRVSSLTNVISSGSWLAVPFQIFTRELGIRPGQYSAWDKNCPPPPIRPLGSAGRPCQTGWRKGLTFWQGDSLPGGLMVRRVSPKNG